MVLLTTECLRRMKALEIGYEGYLQSIHWPIVSATFWSLFSASTAVPLSITPCSDCYFAFFVFRLSC